MRLQKLSPLLDVNRHFQCNSALSLISALDELLFICMFKSDHCQIQVISSFQEKRNLNIDD